MLASRWLVLLTLALGSVGCGESHGPRADGAVDGMDGSPSDRDGGARFDGSDAAGALVDAADTPVDAAVPPADAGPALPEDCTPGTAAPCACPLGRGFRYCTDAGWSAGCECTPPPIGGTPDGGAGDGGTAFPDASLPCTGDPEWCDGADNDCDGLIDEGHVCPDSTVRAAVPFAGTVYAYYRPWARGCCYHFRPISPRRPDEATGETDDVLTRHTRLVFRPDGEIAYLDSAGTVRLVAEDVDPEIPTPPCFSGVSWFDFDGAGRFYYMCGTTVRRGNGEIVHATLPSSPDLFDDSRVLASGRIVARVGSTEHVFLELDGTISARWSPSDWSGTMIFANYIYQTVVQGESAFLMYRRTYRGGTRNELVIFRADGASHTFTPVRRIPVGAWPEEAVALPDGRVVASPSTRDYQQFVEYPVDGPPGDIEGHYPTYEYWAKVMAVRGF